MAMIFISRDRQSLGQFTEQEVADGLASGKFFPTDLAWREPMACWEPLATFAGLPPSVPGAAAEPLPVSITEAPPAPIGVEPAWERAEGGLSFGAMVESVKAILTKPQTVFSAMPVEGGYGKPLKFYVFVGWITGAIGIVYQLAASLINPAMFLGEQSKGASPTTIVGIFVGVAIFYPIFLALGSFVSAGFMHVGMMVVGGAKKPFEATYRAVCYANGACSIGQVVPLCGPYIYGLASLVYTVIALKETHRTDLWRPIVAMLLMFVFCCGIIFAAVVGLAGLAGAVGAVAK